MTYHRAARALVRRWSASIRVADSPWDTLRLELDRRRGEPARFWWRDDDAIAATPALARLLTLRQRLGVPLALAVIPATATNSLAQAVASDAAVRVLVHGWDHHDHADHRRPSEFPPGRSPVEVRDRLTEGRMRLSKLFGQSVLPVLVPPFNRIAASLSGEVMDAGLHYVSADGDFLACPLPSRNVHVDVVDWRRRSAVSAAEAVRPLVTALRLRRFGLVPPAAPVGVMTHHLIHDAALWALIEELLRQIASHDAAIFPPIADIFHGQE